MSMRVAAAAIMLLRRRRINKCALTNHTLREPKRHKFYTWPAEFRGVADVLTVEVAQCKCGEVVVGGEFSRTSLDGLTMGASDWDRLQEFRIIDY